MLRNGWPLIPLLMLTAAPVGAEPLGLDALVDRIQDTYHQTRDLKAKFEQTYTFKVTGRRKVSSGRLFVKLPGKVRWDYLRPEPKYFLADGEHLWIVTPKDRQVMKQPLGSSEISSLIGFLMGTGDLRKQFTIEMLPQDDAGYYHLKLLPKGSETRFRQVLLTIHPTTYRTMVTEITDPAGNVNRIEFDDIQVNVGLPDSGFQFTVPRGYRVIEAAGPQPDAKGGR